MKKRKIGILLGLIFASIMIINCISSCQDAQKGSSKGAELVADLPSDKDYFIIPESGTRYINLSDITALDKNGWHMAMYEIYARHGMIFTIPEVQKYFERKDWYNGTIKEEDFSTELLNDYEKLNIKVLNHAILEEEEKGMTDSTTEKISIVDEDNTNTELSEESSINCPQYFEENITTEVITSEEPIFKNEFTQLVDDGNYFDEVVSGAWFDDSGMPIAEYPPDGLRSVTWKLYDKSTGTICYKHFDDPMDIDTIKRSAIDNKNTYSMLLKNIQKQTNELGQIYLVGTEYYSNTPIVINGTFTSGIVNGDNILVFAHYTGLASDDTPNFQALYVEIENGRF